MYNTQKEIGANLWNQVQRALQQIPPDSNQPNVSRNPSINSPSTPEQSNQRYGAEFTTRSRLGQGGFRAIVTQEYQKRCAITGEITLPVLEAAHIQSYAEQGPHDVTNGVLLRADLHKLFDKYYITITHDYRVEVSSRIREEYENGRDYYALHGRRLIILPESEGNRPAINYLEWHNNKFVA
jgi:putative restriction endonuclease